MHTSSHGGRIKKQQGAARGTCREQKSRPVQYNGDLTSREAGSVGGQMVKNVSSIRTINYVRNNRIAMGHVQNVQYITSFTI
ncbi:MAG: small, acid-soluble spore protein, alpha/beta type [Faecousia sp.]